MGEDLREEIKKLKKELEELKRALKSGQVVSKEEEIRPRRFVKIPITEAGESVQSRPLTQPTVTPPTRTTSFENQIIKNVLETFRKSVMQVGDKYIAIDRLIEDLSPEGAAQALTVIANDARIKILKMLYYDGKYFSDIEHETGLNPSPLNFHLTKLMQAGLISQEKARGRYIITQKGKVVLTLIAYFWSRFKEVAFI